MPTESSVPVALCCPICRCIFRNPVMLSCGHSFCEGCVKLWLDRKSSCPLCRHKARDAIPNINLREIVSDAERKLWDKKRHSISFDMGDDSDPDSTKNMKPVLKQRSRILRGGTLVSISEKDDISNSEVSLGGYKRTSQEVLRVEHTSSDEGSSSPSIIRRNAHNRLSERVRGSASSDREAVRLQVAHSPFQRAARERRSVQLGYARDTAVRLRTPPISTPISLGNPVVNEGFDSDEVEADETATVPGDTERAVVVEKPEQRSSRTKGFKYWWRRLPKLSMRKKNGEFACAENLGPVCRYLGGIQEWSKSHKGDEMTILVLGKQSVGKTLFVDRCRDLGGEGAAVEVLSFDDRMTLSRLPPPPASEVTGAPFNLSSLVVPCSSGRKVYVDVMDTEFVEEQHADRLLQSADAVVILFGTDCSDTLLAACSYNRVRTRLHKIPGVLVGTKTNSRDRQVVTQTGQRMARNMKIPYFEVDLASGECETLKQILATVCGSVMKVRGWKEQNITL